MKLFPKIPHARARFNERQHSPHDSVTLTSHKSTVVTSISDIIFRHMRKSKALTMARRRAEFLSHIRFDQNIPTYIPTKVAMTDRQYKAPKENADRMSFHI